jgi:hypothetical protein
LGGSGLFIERLDEYYERMKKSTERTEVGFTEQMPHRIDAARRLRINVNVVHRAKTRWQKRENEPWYGNCGSPGPKRLRCGGCRTA